MLKRDISHIRQICAALVCLLYMLYFFCVLVVCYKSDFPVGQHIIGLILKQMVESQILILISIAKVKILQLLSSILSNDKGFN